MSSQQLGIPGIGQQKMTLKMWKSDNKVFSHNAPHMEDWPWCCWAEMEFANDFLNKYGQEAFGFGKTEKECILKFCGKHDIEPPFWWKE